MATKFTPINQRKQAADIRHVPSGSPDVSPCSPPMSPLSPPPSWFNDEDMECPHTPIRTQSASLLAPSTSSPLRSKSNHTERSSPSPLLVGQGLAPSTLLFPHLPAPALQKNARPAAHKRDSEELGTEEVEHGPRATRRKNSEDIHTRRRNCIVDSSQQHERKPATLRNLKDRQCYPSDEADYVKHCSVSRFAKVACIPAMGMLVAY